MAIIKLRRGNASEWTTVNPILASGEVGVELDTYKFKIGDGIHPWGVLSYFVSQSDAGIAIADEIQAHIDDPNAHPQYLTDAPSDGKNYARKDAVWTEITGGDGVRSAQEYTYNANISAPPSSGQLRLNNDVQGSATTIYLSFMNVIGEDVRLYYKDLRAGDVFIVQDKDDGTKYQVYDITGPAVNQSTYAEIPVIWVSGGTALPSGQRVLFLITSRSGGTGGSARTTASVTTASIAANATATGTINLGKAYRLYKITTSAPARVRLYTENTKLSADASRPIGTDPTGDHGLIFEFISDATLLSADLSPMVDGFDGGIGYDGLISYSITNKDTSSKAITVQFMYMKTEG